MPTTIAFWSPSPAELIIILVVALLLFGKRLPEVARSLGRGLTEFKRGLHEEPPVESSSSAHRIDAPTAAPTPTPEPTPAPAQKDEAEGASAPDDDEPADQERPPE